MDVRHPTQHGGAGSLQLETRSHRRDTHLRFECQRHEAQVQSNRQIHKERAVDQLNTVHVVSVEVSRTGNQYLRKTNAISQDRPISNPTA